MSRKLHADDLVGLAEIARRLRVSRETLKTTRRRDPTFPAPVADLERGSVWAWPDVQAWAERKGWPDQWPRKRRR